VAIARTGDDDEFLAGAASMVSILESVSILGRSAVRETVDATGEKIGIPEIRSDEVIQMKFFSDADFFGFKNR